ncbi:hypothetical protein GLYMA_18G261500v4 [Glycine max]|uniref:Uncharacterized protein n=1 Tax=Glycine max TaxID=3847 RepID=A0A0R0FEL3_SOYBN|nr:hypothetical protein GYH30_051158 [Glycine max]KRH01209.1 hypothetical protein GLYMA_18G261500v4 [Glycine max]
MFTAAHNYEAHKIEDENHAGDQWLSNSRWNA